MSAIVNSVGAPSLYSYLNPSMNRCTLDEIDYVYEDARAAVNTHVEAFRKSDGPKSAGHERMAQQIISMRREMPAPTANQSRLFARDIVGSYDESTSRYLGQRLTDQPRRGFCEDLTSRIINAIHPYRYSSIESRLASHWTVISLLLGRSVAGRYPDKAESILIQGRQPFPAGGRDTRAEQVHFAYSEGFRGDEALLRSIERDLKTKDLMFIQEGHGRNWILMQILSRLGDESRQDETVDVTLASEAIFGAIKDGIGFGLFITPRGPLHGTIPEEFMKYHIGDTQWIGDLLDASMEKYEELYGVLR